MPKCPRCGEVFCDFCGVKIEVCCICYHNMQKLRRKCDWCDERKRCEYCAYNEDGCCLCVHERKVRSNG